ncbi:MAG: hypothetical protein JW966_06055 [Anaerolineae bacterium]|nr:hypothetical protein [Anaerolineae bacterium]
MQFNQVPQRDHQRALSAVLGEPGRGGLVFVLLATGAGLLLDFVVIRLHPLFSVGLVLISVPLSHYWPSAGR